MAVEGRLQMSVFSRFARKIKVSAFGVQELDKSVVWLPADRSIHHSCE